MRTSKVRSYVHYYFTKMSFVSRTCSQSRLGVQRPSVSLARRKQKQRLRMPTSTAESTSQVRCSIRIQIAHVGLPGSGDQVRCLYVQKLETGVRSKIFQRRRLFESLVECFKYLLGFVCNNECFGFLCLCGVGYAFKGKLESASTTTI